MRKSLVVAGMRSANSRRCRYDPEQPARPHHGRACDASRRGPDCAVARGEVDTAKLTPVGAALPGDLMRHELLMTPGRCHRKRLLKSSTRFSCRWCGHNAADAVRQLVFAVKRGPGGSRRACGGGRRWCRRSWCGRGRGTGNRRWPVGRCGLTMAPARSVLSRDGR